MRTTQNKSVNKQPFRLPLTAIVLGLSSVAAALVISFVAYKYTLETTEKHHQLFYLNKAKTFAADIKEHNDYSDKKMLKSVNSLWQNSKKSAPDEYLCVVDKNGNLIFCTIHPDMIGNYIGDNAIISDSQQPDRTLIDIVKSKTDYVGTYISSKGAEQIAAFVHIPDRQWFLGIHRSKTVMLGEVRSNVHPLFIGLVIVCGLLMPASLFLMYHTFYLSQQRRRLAEQALKQSETKYRTLYESSKDAIMIFDPEKQSFISVNSAAIKLFGCRTERDLLFKSPLDFTPQYQPNGHSSSVRIKQIILETLKKKTNSFEWLHKKIDGTEFPAIVSLNCMELEGKTVIQAVTRDVSEQKQIEKTLQENEAKYRTLYESSQDAIAILDMEKGFINVNPAFIKLFGFKTRKELLNKTPLDLTPEYQPDGTLSSIEINSVATKALEEGSSFFELRHKRIDGSEFPATVLLARIELEGKTVLQGTVRDITERKKTEQALQESEKKIRTLLDTIPHAIYECDVNGIITTANSFYAKITGYSKEELASMHVWDLQEPGEQRDSSPEYFKYLLAEQPEPTRYVCRNLTKDGRIINVQIDWTYKRNEQGRIIGFVCVLSDIAVRKKIEEKYRLIFETAATLITSVNSQGLVVDCNHRIKEMLGYERKEIIGQTMGKIIHPDYLPKAQKALKEILTKGFLYNHDYKMVHKNGKLIDVTMNSSAMKGEDGQYERTICIITDITERVQAEQQARKHQEDLAHVSRLSTIGEMASGLAHELNQPLSAILSYANACSHLIKGDSPDIEKIKNSLEIIAAQTIRSGEIIHRIKNFVRKTEPRRTDININDIVKNVSDFIDADIIRNKIVLKLDLTKQMPMVLADSIQIEQVLLNLALNSIEALADEQSRKRQLTIKTSTHNGDTIEVEVCDSGKGLDSEIKQKIFDSFFSTKPEGLGIGLSISRSIIESHKGQIWATENRDGGTKFKFTLPIAHAALTL